MKKLSKHWIVAACCAGLMAGSLGISVNSIGVFYAVVSNDLGVARSEFTLHATIASIAMGLIPMFIARFLNDRQLKPVIVIGVLLAGIASALMGVASSLPVFYVLGALKGLGCGCFCYLTVNSIINQWFVKNHGTVMGVVAGSTGITGAIFSAVFPLLIQSIGWRPTYMISGGLIILFGLPAMLVNFKFHPEAEGLLPYGVTSADARPVKTATATGADHHFNLLQLSVICIFIMQLISVMNTSLPQHLAGFGESIGYTAIEAATLVSAAMIGNVASKFVMGVLCDKLGVVKAYIFMLLASIAALAGLAEFSALVLLQISAFLFGSIFGISSVGSTILIRQICGDENYSRVYSICNFLGNLSGAFAMSLIALVYDLCGSYRPVFLILLGVQVTTGILLIIAVNGAKKLVR